MKIKVVRRVSWLWAAGLLAASALADETPMNHANHRGWGAGNHAAAGLEKAVREGTSRYRDVAVAESEGWTSTHFCVSGPDIGAMGVHYANGPLVGDDKLDPLRPEMLIYEQRNDTFRLVGVEFIVLYDVWHAQGRTDTPTLMGQLFHYTGAPNRYGLPPFYSLHVWAWRSNPLGTYATWNTRVSCDQFVEP
ncbi:MAG: hypothetical protein AB7G76_15865 [Steroidobacteraceae bacterium]